MTGGVQNVNAETVILELHDGRGDGNATLLFDFNELLSHDVSVAPKYKIAAIDDNFASPEEKCELYEYLKLSSNHLIEKILG